jgi:hypothetical protein
MTSGLGGLQTRVAAVEARVTTRLTDLRIGRCRDYRRELEAEGLSGKTVTNILGLLHKAMADAVEEGLLRVNAVPRLARRSRRAQGLRSNCARSRSTR